MVTAPNTTPTATDNAVTVTVVATAPKTPPTARQLANVRKALRGRTFTGLATIASGAKMDTDTAQRVADSLVAMSQVMRSGKGTAAQYMLTDNASVAAGQPVASAASQPAASTDLVSQPVASADLVSQPVASRTLAAQHAATTRRVAVAQQAAPLASVASQPAASPNDAVAALLAALPPDMLAALKASLGVPMPVVVPLAVRASGRTMTIAQRTAIAMQAAKDRHAARLASQPPKPAPMPASQGVRAGQSPAQTMAAAIAQRAASGRIAAAPKSAQGAVAGDKPYATGDLHRVCDNYGAAYGAVCADLTPAISSVAACAVAQAQGAARATQYHALQYCAQVAVAHGLKPLHGTVFCNSAEMVAYNVMAACGTDTQAAARVAATIPRRAFGGLRYWLLLNADGTVIPND